MTLDESEILSARILIVDDQIANVDLLRAMLADAGFTCVDSTNKPREVVALHASHNYALILLDLHMPEMDGFEVMEALKEIESGYLPVLVLTAQPAHKLRALLAGAKDFVSSPYDLLEVQTRIRNMVEVRLLYRRIENDNRQLEETVRARTTELRESEARFRALVELASDWYWEQDEHGRFTKTSGPALEMLGMNQEGDQQKSEQLRWNLQERAFLEEKLAMRRPFLDFVYSRIHADGSEQFLQTSGEPTFDAAGRFTGYRGIGMDVTGRMRVNNTARRQNDLERFRLAMDATAHAIFLVDRSSMRFVDVNAAACSMFGYSREEFFAAGPGTLTGQADSQHEHDYDQLIAGNGAAGASRVPLLRKDGSTLPVEVHRHASHSEAGWMLVEVVRDLTGLN